MEFGMLDTNREARFESMRRQSRSAQVFRRHEDLRKQCEREVKLYEKAKRLMHAECRRTQMQCMDRLKTLDNYCPSHLRPTHNDQSAFIGRVAASLDPLAANRRFLKNVSRSAPDDVTQSGGDKKQRKGDKEKFLFRVLHRNGKELYIRDEEKARQSRILLNYVDVASDAKPRRTKSYHL
ncbi:hypothetical protein BaRGS_00021237 [Batillaria attramentaria]|uniref:Uncharacterized protein n=1 Tax=Batillaria attramentaria TaxID=370345 RepID=A0ABD0KKN2_9CAEN|nr:hypothetical protein BaRGS_029871 [Batillaria attramentaria]